MKTVFTPHEQFISRNQEEIARMITNFNDLNNMYDGNLSLYLGSDGWEVFDVRIARTLFRHEFRHVRQLNEDICKLNNDIMLFFNSVPLVCRGNKPKNSMVWSIKAIIRLYGTDDSYFFNNATFLNYIQNGFTKKEKDVADNY